MGELVHLDDFRKSEEPKKTGSPLYAALAIAAVGMLAATAIVAKQPHTPSHGSLFGPDNIARWTRLIQL